MESLLAISPSLLALVMAFTTRRVILSLFSAVALGFLILNDYALLSTSIAVFEQGIFQQLQEVMRRSSSLLQ